MKDNNNANTIKTKLENIDLFNQIRTYTNKHKKYRIIFLYKQTNITSMTLSLLLLYVSVKKRKLCSTLFLSEE